MKGRRAHLADQLAQAGLSSRPSMSTTRRGGLSANRALRQRLVGLDRDARVFVRWPDAHGHDGGLPGRRASATSAARAPSRARSFERAGGVQTSRSSRRQAGGVQAKNSSVTRRARRRPAVSMAGRSGADTAGLLRAIRLEAGPRLAKMSRKPRLPTPVVEAVKVEVPAWPPGTSFRAPPPRRSGS